MTVYEIITIVYFCLVNTYSTVCKVEVSTLESPTSPLLLDDASNVVDEDDEDEDIDAEVGIELVEEGK